MKRIFCVLACTAAAVCAADLASVRTVYVMPMSRGMDQYLANRLAAERAFKVVNDLKLADAVFADHLGEDLTSSFDDLNTDKPVEDPKGSATPPKISSVPVNHLDNPATSSSFGRAKGVFFLVDAKTRQVLWSTFEPPRRFDSGQMDRTASDIVSRLKRDLKQGEEVGAKPAKQPAAKAKRPQS